MGELAARSFVDRRPGDMSSMERSRRDEILARYELRSRAFDEIAQRRRGSDCTVHSAVAQPKFVETLSPTRELAEPVPTPRELKILALVATGMTDSEIASQLSSSIWTVKEHVVRLLAKLEARNRAQAVAIGLHRGLIR